jgi:hypothetical protein
MMLACHPLPAEAAGDRTDAKAIAILDAYKVATGGDAWGKLKTLRIRSDLSGSELTGTADTWLDLAHGWYSASSHMGLEKSGNGFDGKQVWHSDTAGQVQIEGSVDQRVAAANETYRIAHGYWFRERFPAAIAYVGGSEDGASDDDVIEMTPVGGRAFKLFVDRRTHLPHKMVEAAPLGTQVETYGDWRPVSDVMVPFRVEISTNDQGVGDTIETVREVTASRPLLATRYAPPAPPPPDFSFPAGKASISIPFDLENNHVYVEALVEGKPARLMFDTGSTGFLDTNTLGQFGLSAVGALPAQGSGAKIERGGLVKVRELKLGGVVFRDQVLGALDESGFAAVEGGRVDGVLGYEVVKRLPVDIDYGAKRLTIFKPSAFRPPAGAVPVPIKFFAQIPEVQARIDGIEGEFVIDTGSRASLLLLKPFIDRNKLQGRFGSPREALVGWSIGGPVRGLLARVGALDIGGIAIDDPVTIIPERGPPVDGNIGGGILRHFDIAFDYAHDRIWLRPLSSAPDVYDRSGIWANLGPQGMTIAEVLPDSPASDSGLAPGDVVQAVDGESASKLTLPRLRESLKQAPGTIVQITVEHDGRPRSVSLSLRDLV